jgi:hypothetical protein
MNPQDLLALLGRQHTDPLVEAALRHYGVRNRPEVEFDEDDPDGPVVETQSWVKNSREGVEFGFQDEAAWIGLDETEFGKRPMVLSQIYMYGQHEGVRPYKERLPFGLELTDDRTTVRRKMQSLEPTRHSHIRDAWDAAGYRMTVAFTEGDQSIDFVLCLLLEPPLPPPPYQIAPVPALDRLSAVLGQALSEQELLDTFASVGLRGKMDEIEETHEANFRNPYGFALGFSTPIDETRGSQFKLVLSRVTMYRERELDARGWRGELPFTITFDDSPETVVRKLARPPDYQADFDFDGYAVWHLPTMTLLVFYNIMENRVARVNLFAPGYWKSGMGG